MNNKTNRIISLFLVILLVFCLGGCAPKGNSGSSILNNEKVQLLNEKFVELIDCDVAHDSESAYALLYPGVTDSETFNETAQSIYVYFPVTEDYTWELLNWDIYIGKTIVGKKEASNYMTGQYKIEFGENVYYAFVTWRYDSEAEGFTQFRIISEKDYQEYLKSNNKK